VIDAFTLTGHYPFRRIKASLENITGILEKEGFTDIFTVSFGALFYRNFNEGNRELLEEVVKTQLNRGRLRVHLLAGINPFYISNISEIKELSSRYRAVVISPLYQGFNISSRRVIHIVKTASEANLPVIILGYLEDPREMHRAYRFRYALSSEKVKAFFELLRNTREELKVAFISFPFKILSELSSEISKFSVYIDVSSNDVYGPMYDYVKLLVDSIGEDLVIFASKTPLTYLKSILYKVLYSDIEESKKYKILLYNAKKLFNIR